MVLELHIWGPAFSLPSIDAQCLAAVAYLKRAVPREEWALIPSSNPSLSPKGELPALKNGSTWVCGFSNIVDYLRQYSEGEWDLNASLDPQERADCIAFSSLIDSQGQPLIDLSLYVSSLNYTSLTRSAYALILPWPNSWIYPPRIRAAAKERSNHLGLSSLDIDSVDAPQPDSTTSQIPTHLLKKSKETVTSLLGQGQQHNQFRLESLTSAFFAPLQDLLAQKPFLLGTAQLSSLDCLAVGHLSLALFPEVPHPWLQTSLKDKFPFLASYTERISRACFGPPINALNYISTVPNDPRRKAFETDPLPWVAAQTPSLTSVGATILENIADSLPVISQIRTNNRLRHAAADPDLAHMERSNLKTLSANQRKEFLSQVVTVVAGISAFVGYMYYHGVLTPEADYEEDKAEEIKEASNPGPFGEAGALLFGRMPAGKPGEPGPR